MRVKSSEAGPRLKMSSSMLSSIGFWQMKIAWRLKTAWTSLEAEMRQLYPELAPLQALSTNNAGDPPLTDLLPSLAGTGVCVLLANSPLLPGVYFSFLLLGYLLQFVRPLLRRPSTLFVTLRLNSCSNFSFVYGLWLGCLLNSSTPPLLTSSDFVGLHLC